MGFWVLARPCHTLESESVVEAICTEGDVCLLLLTPARARCCNCSFYPTLTPPLLVTLTTLVGLFYGLMVQIMPSYSTSVGPAMDQTKGCVNEQELAATSLVRTETVELTEWACSVHTTVPKRPLTKRIF